MARTKSQEVTKTAGQNFAGTEFDLAPRAQSLLKLLQIVLVMGPESKTWRIEMTSTKGSPLILKQSMSSATTAGPNKDTDVLISGKDVEVLLEAGEQIQAFTADGTAPMRMKVLYADAEPGELL